MNAPFNHKSDGPALREYLIAEPRLAASRVRLLTNDLDAVGVMLKGGRITPYEAMEELYWVGALPFLNLLPEVDVIFVRQAEAEAAVMRQTVPA
jgi:hypothetical protein